MISEHQFFKNFPGGGMPPDPLSQFGLRPHICALRKTLSRPAPLIKNIFLRPCKSSQNEDSDHKVSASFMVLVCKLKAAHVTYMHGNLPLLSWISNIGVHYFTQPCKKLTRSVRVRGASAICEHGAWHNCVHCFSSDSLENARVSA